MGQIAPEPTLRAALRVLYVAAYTTRNWTLSEGTSRKQINDLWEAIHEIPDLLKRWDAPEKCEAELKMYLREYDSKWQTPKLEAIFEQALSGARDGE
jgi:hypothetical protein